ncbi:MAG: glycosyltransferase family 2 protein [Lachnospiraceae bacterium]|nr:glycosyltransferase family 2 protein [Lachnospiraceae bacterium]
MVSQAAGSQSAGLSAHQCTTLYLVLPCYNEEEVLMDTAAALEIKYNKLMEEKKISRESKIMFVNDGSKDRTWDIITELFHRNAVFCGINLSRNRGHQNAVLAGLMTAREKADVVISIDADLQQDIEAIDLMLEKYENGCDVVYGVRNTRSTDGFVKKNTALGFYKLMQMMGCEVITNHADYRLMSKRVIESLAEYGEVNLFLRGLIPTIGYPSDAVYFDVKERQAGESKYTMKKMLSFAVDGITSFSIRPLQLITILGFLMLIVSIVMVAATIYDYYTGRTVPGWASSYCSTWFIGSIQLLSLGVMGEYIGKIYMETKHRPRYHIEAYLWKDRQEKEE